MKVYCVDLVLGVFDIYFCYIVYDFDLFEEGLFVNLIVLIIGNIFGFKVVKVFCFEDMCMLVVLLKIY